VSTITGVQQAISLRLYRSCRIAVIDVRCCPEVKLLCAGTEAELQVREAPSNERAPQRSQGPINCHHCRLAQSPRVAEELDEAVVCPEAWYTPTVQEQQS